RQTCPAQLDADFHFTLCCVWHPDRLLRKECGQDGVLVAKINAGNKVNFAAAIGRRASSASTGRGVERLPEQMGVFIATVEAGGRPSKQPADR
ncbi:MAG: hypothetical protein JJ992_02615, partial [Planctomycetes bacterium]|nr:hypothetical protein [Planctomycetota bacterium]